MDARSLLLTLLTLIACAGNVQAQVFVGPRTVVETPNFRVYARSGALANEIARIAEDTRKQLAMHWLGEVIPNWPEPCPLMVNDGPNTPASGETKYTLVAGGVANFQMTVSGTPQRIVDSVLPHEITHTILASHFAALGKPVPRWADEGACTTVEHLSERSKHDHMLVRYLGEGRGIPFATLFALKEYPPDMMPLYAQGYSLSCFLIAQGGPQHFVKFLDRGMADDDWINAVEEFYFYPKLGKLQAAWNKWVSDGGGTVASYTADALGISNRAIAATAGSTAPNTFVDPNIRLAGANQSQGINRGIANNAPQFESLGYASAPAASAIAEPPRMADLNNSVNPSSSYYLEQLRRNKDSALAVQGSQTGNSVVPASANSVLTSPNAIPYRASQPTPFQTVGGGIIRR